jgi:hypothetical protein
VHRVFSGSGFTIGSPKVRKAPLKRKLKRTRLTLSISFRLGGLFRREYAFIMDRLARSDVANSMLSAVNRLPEGGFDLSIRSILLSDPNATLNPTEFSVRQNLVTLIRRIRSGM